MTIDLLEGPFALLTHDLMYCLIVFTYTPFFILFEIMSKVMIPNKKLPKNMSAAEITPRHEKKRPKSSFLPTTLKYEKKVAENINPVIVIMPTMVEIDGIPYSFS